MGLMGCSTSSSIATAASSLSDKAIKRQKDHVSMCAVALGWLLNFVEEHPEIKGTHATLHKKDKRCSLCAAPCIGTFHHSLMRIDYDVCDGCMNGDSRGQALESGPYEIVSSPFSTGQVTYDIIKPAVKDRGCRYVDFINDNSGTAVSRGRVEREGSEAVSRGKAFFFVGHGWGRPFVELVDQLVEHFKPENQAVWRKGAPVLRHDEIYVWLDIFAINQNEGASQGNDLSQLKEVVAESEQTLMILDKDGLVFTRIWCLYEAWHSGKKEKKESLKLLAYGLDWEALLKVFLQLDVSKAHATVPSDLEMILADIASDIGIMTMTHQLKDALVDSVAVPQPDDDLQWNQEKLDLLYRAATMAKVYGRLDESLAFHRRSLHGKTIMFVDPIHPTILESKNSIGYVLQLLERLEESEQMYREAYDGRNQALGADHKDTITSLSCLASLSMDLGKLEDAESLFEKAIEGYERVLGASHISTLICLSQLGSCLRLNGQLDKSEVIQRSCLELREKTLGFEHHHTLHSLHRLGLVLIDKGQIDLAKPYGLRAVAERTKVLGRDHKDTLESVKMMERVEELERNSVKLSSS